MFAIVDILVTLPADTSLRIHIDSAATIALLRDDARQARRHASTLRMARLPNTALVTLADRLLEHRRAIGATTHFEKVAAHTGVAGSERADALAKHAAQHFARPSWPTSLRRLSIGAHRFCLRAVGGSAATVAVERDAFDVPLTNWLRDSAIASDFVARLRLRQQGAVWRGALGLSARDDVATAAPLPRWLLLHPWRAMRASALRASTGPPPAASPLQVDARAPVARAGGFDLASRAGALAHVESAHRRASSRHVQWLVAAHGLLVTRQRLFRLQLVASPNCRLCRARVAETVDHVMFDCEALATTRRECAMTLDHAIRVQLERIREPADRDAARAALQGVDVARVTVPHGVLPAHVATAMPLPLHAAVHSAAVRWGALLWARRTETLRYTGAT